MTNTVGNAGGGSLAEFLAESGPVSRTADETASTADGFAATLARETAKETDNVQATGQDGSAREVARGVMNAEIARTSTDPVEWITKDSWAEHNLLSEDLSAETLHRVVDPAALLNARLEAVRSPTDAQVLDDNGGPAQGINSSGLSTLEQAETMLARLKTLGIDAGEIVDLELRGPYRMSFGSDARRYYLIDGHNVGHLIERYAKMPVEVADRMTQAEFS